MNATRSSLDPRIEAPSAPTNWLEAYAGLVGHWIEWQSEMWQPLADAQAECARFWQDRCGWPPAVALRGAEQLG
jgi:hypothetical protein